MNFSSARPVKRVMVVTDTSPLAGHAEARSAMLVREPGRELPDMLYID